MPCIYCELTARILEIPVTVILMPSTIPLLPGSTIYYTMLYAVKSDTDKMLEYVKATISAGLGIALGATVSTIIIRLAVSLAKKCRK
ncbi:MAG: threonine/serine exporter family protein [Clostridiales bacterium]|nr:threonine/serine exporter family protein [Clostridiales bacterium]